jgi:hypothetical protein
MKKFFACISFAFLFMPFLSKGQAVQGTITDPNPGGNLVRVYGKIGSPGLTNAQFLNINITISIPDQSGGLGNPTDAEITKTSLISNLGITPALNSGLAANPWVSNGRAYYSYILNDNGNGVGTTWPANSNNNPIAEFTFPRNNFFSGMRLDDLSPDGGANQQMYWYVNVIGGGDLTDYSTMFYGVPDLPPSNNGGAAPSFVGIQPFSVVPVNFLGFTATKNNNSALLYWQVANEGTNTDRYEIEISGTGIEFEKQATVPAFNNGRQGNNYSFTQDNLSALRNSGVIYFRIKQIDLDGKFVYSAIRSVRLDGKSFSAGVYPNPVKSSTKLTIDLLESMPLIISVTDATGKQVRSFQYQGVKGPNFRDIDMSSLSSGSYIIKVQAGADVKNLPVVKTR